MATRRSTSDPFDPSSNLEQFPNVFNDVDPGSGPTGDNPGQPELAPPQDVPPEMRLPINFSPDTTPELAPPQTVPPELDPNTPPPMATIPEQIGIPIPDNPWNPKPVVRPSPSGPHALALNSVGGGFSGAVPPPQPMMNAPRRRRPGRVGQAPTADNTSSLNLIQRLLQSMEIA